MLRSKYTMIRDTPGTYRDNVTPLTPASADPNVRWNVCNEIHAAYVYSTWRLAEAEFIIINRNNIKLFHFTISGDRNIVFVLLIFHGFVWKDRKIILRARSELKFENCESVQHTLQFSGIKKGPKFHFIGTLKGLFLQHHLVLSLFTLR